MSQPKASTSKQKLGQKEWVEGARDLAHGFSQITVALQEIERGNQAGARQEAIAARKTIKTADLLG